MEEVGVILLLAMTVAPVGVAFAMLPLSIHPDHDGQAATFCGDHPFQEPYCRQGKPVQAPDRPGIWCGPLLVDGPNVAPDSPVGCFQVSAAILVREPTLHAPGST